MDKRLLIASLAAGIGGALIGGGITYLTVKKTFAERAQRDIDEVKQYYHDKFDGKRVINDYGQMPQDDAGIIPTLAETRVTEAVTENIQEVQDFVEELAYVSTAERDEAAAQEAREKEIEDRELSIYDRTEEPPADAVEVEDLRLIGYNRDALREDKKPYLISHEEFNETETDWSKISITYYEDDDTLADESDKAIMPGDIDRMVGEIHLDFFGIRSDDANTVYVRNGQISADFEITRNSGNFQEIVLNVPKGGEKLGVRRMRAGDDE